jgi:hypothetical protein
LNKKQKKVIGHDNGQCITTMLVDQQIQVPFEISFDLNKELIMGVD